MIHLLSFVQVKIFSPVYKVRALDSHPFYTGGFRVWWKVQAGLEKSLGLLSESSNVYPTLQLPGTCA